MREFKRIKDPIYGYIQIPVTYMTDIVDTSAFQRLRRILQTSYSPLYSSAVHNRFVHSMGVYYLGELASEQLLREIDNKFGSGLALQGVGETFKLACLLHDVGHAPFSHTGETFYLEDGQDFSGLHAMLADAVGSDTFRTDIPADKSQAAAPHEIMSAVIGLDEYADFFPDTDQRELFARCITGYKYSDQSSVENNIKNCFISLLNSKVIDVDKLDYLIRDAFITGFDTVNIDFERLLTSITISKVGGRYEITYGKNAISVIENVVYAHDAERKWIQTHPVVLYETYILQHIISYLSGKIDGDGRKLFSRESLSVEGQMFDNGVHVSLLCDDDIIYLMKNVFPGELNREFFERRERRHPVWKSEAKYKVFLLDLAKGGSLLEEFEKAMSATAKYLVKSTDSWVIDNELIAKLEAERQRADETDMDAMTKEVQMQDKDRILKVMHALQNYADEKKFPCNFVVLMASQFGSGFGKVDFAETKIAFHTKDGEKINKFSEIVSSFEAKKKERENFFYLFYKRDPDADVNEIDIDNQEICRRLFQKVVF